MPLKPRAAMIFAAGFGTRMGALTRDIPKPMVPLAGRPMIDHAVGRLRAAGIEHIVANTHHLHDRIAPHLSDLGVTVVHESDGILDTGGGLLNALPALGDGPILTLNPDAAWTGDDPITTLLEHWTGTAEALLLVKPIQEVSGRQGAGDFRLENGALKRGGPLVYTGAQILTPDRLSQIEGPVFSLNQFWDLCEARGTLAACRHAGGWCDIGHPDGLAMANRMLSDG